MPKRSIDYGKLDPSVPPEKMHSKTERSHEENQERAYIAASRRADRSLEARVQSARMASEIHKKRTGKGFRISEEIVMKEEMYEEEEDDFPRSYRLLGPHMQTASAEMNFRVEAYLTNKMAMSRLVARTNEDWRENEINKLFAQSFPNAGIQAQQISQRLSNPNYPGQTNQGEAMPQSPMSPSAFHNVSYHQTSHDGSTTHSTLSPPAAPMSPTALTPGSGPKSPSMHTAPMFASTMGPDPSMDFGSGQSAFTSELPPEARMLMAGLDMTGGAFDANMFDQSWMDTQFYDTPDMSKRIKTGPFEHEPPINLFDTDPSATQKWDTADPTSCLEEPLWDSFLNDSAWNNEQ